MSREQIRAPLHHAQRARVVWLNGVIGWGLSAAVIWCVAMWLLRSETDLAEDIVVALTLFPMAGYAAGRMMWQDRLHAAGSLPTANPPDAQPRDADAYTQRAAELDATWSRVLTVWWALTWRSLIAMMISVAVAAILGGLLGGLIGGLSPGAFADIGSGLAQLFGGAVGLIASIVPVKLILGKDFGEFRLVLLAKRPRTKTAEIWGGELGASDPSRAAALTFSSTQSEPEPGPER